MIIPSAYTYLKGCGADAAALEAMEIGGIPVSCICHRRAVLDGMWRTAAISHTLEGRNAFLCSDAAADRTALVHGSISLRQKGRAARKTSWHCGRTALRRDAVLDDADRRGMDG